MKPRNTAEAIANRRKTMIAKHGSKENYKDHMREIGAMSRRPKDTVDSLIKRIKVVAINEGKEVKIEVRRRNGKD